MGTHDGLNKETHWEQRIGDGSEGSLDIARHLQAMYVAAQVLDLRAVVLQLVQDALLGCIEHAGLLANALELQKPPMQVGGSSFTVWEKLLGGQEGGCRTSSDYIDRRDLNGLGIRSDIPSLLDSRNLATGRLHGGLVLGQLADNEGFEGVVTACSGDAAQL
jgi:hypothetical protein